MITKKTNENNYKILCSYEMQLLQKFDLQLTENLKQSRSVKYYAEILAISAKKLNYITKKYFAKSAKEYIEEKIILESKILLIESPETVKQISYNLGFTEPTNFNKFFKKFTTITPLQYRKQYIKSSGFNDLSFSTKEYSRNSI